jgi:DHA1 family tetracycline resistance protein-like MFS transporter
MSATPTRKPALGFIFVTLVFLVLGFGIITPIIPNLVVQFKGGSFADGSNAYGLLIGCFAAMQFVANPVLGSLSDRFGRRKVILVALAGTAIDYVVTGFAPSLAWMFGARMVSGVTAGAMATCNAYIADVTPPERRAAGYGLVGAALGLGLLVGPALGGVLGGVNLRLPFFVAAGCVALNFAYGFFVLPESLPEANRRPFSWARANPVGSLLALRKIRGVADLAWMSFFAALSDMMMRTIWVLYTGYRYHWGPAQVGLCLAYVGAAVVLVQVVLVRRVIAAMGERRALILGLVVSVLAMASYGLATRGWVLYALVSVGALGGIAGPAGQALITRHVPADEQGAVQGSLGGIVGLCGVVGPLLATWSFSRGIPGLPGIPLFIASGLYVVALFLAYHSFRRDDALGDGVAPGGV